MSTDARLPKHRLPYTTPAIVPLGSGQLLTRGKEKLHRNIESTIPPSSVSPFWYHEGPVGTLHGPPLPHGNTAHYS